MGRVSKTKLQLVVVFVILVSLGSMIYTHIAFDNASNSLNAYQMIMCPYQNCVEKITNVLKKGDEEIKCAFYHLDQKDVISQLNTLSNNGVSIDIVVDNQYKKELEKLNSNIETTTDSNRKTKYNNYMHHKFCVVDKQTTLISSANPTNNGLKHNNNNIAVFESKSISAIFLEEFSQLKSGVFGYHKLPTTTQSSFSYKNSSIEELSFFMCPQDNCEDNLLKILNKANKSIYFANFVLTLDSVEQILINKSSNIKIKGVLDDRLWNTQNSIAENLSTIFNLSKFESPHTMHHKFFVIDNTFVVIGSMNPTSSGVNYNDENMIIIKSPEIASMFIEEVKRLR